MKSYKSKNALSEVTKRLLAEGEGDRADFKKIPDGINAEDLVAFANSESGGTLLAGITETTGPSGAQIGVVSGCDVSDGSILQIMNKASSCFPPIAIKVYIENKDNKSILRIDVPSSEHKPHCTAKGIYCRRDGNRNRPLHPSELLQIFLDNEARAFAARFEESAARITSKLSELESSLESSIDDMADKLGWASSQLGDTESLLGTINARVGTIHSNILDNTKRLRVLFRQDKREDPVRAEAGQRLKDAIIKQFEQEPEGLDSIKTGDNLTISLPSTISQELTQEEIQAIVNATIKQLKEDRKQLMVSPKPTRKKSGSK